MESPKATNTRTLILIFSTILAVICLCACLVTLLSAGVIWLARDGQSPAASPIPTQEVSVQMDDIQQQVIRLRGIQATTPVTRTLLSPEQLHLNVTEDFLQDYTLVEAKQDALVLSAFGLLKPDFDLFGFYLELYSEQIAGYYDNKTKEMFVVQGSGFNGPERLTYAHEYDHFLQDQAYDIRKGLRYTDDECDDGSERCRGIQALLEGDASLLELKWFEQYATAADRSQVTEYYAGLQSPVYDNAPPFMKEDFVFPYNQGLDFVQYLYDQSGWESVDLAYALPPISSEQILHPEVYPSEAPRQVTLPDLTAALGADWSEIDHGVMGEWYTYLILAYSFDPAGRVDDSQAKQAAAGWGGDAYVVYAHQPEQSLVMALISDWDSETDAQEFEQAFYKFARGHFGQEQAGAWATAQGTHQFLRQGNRTTWLLAPDLETSNALWDLLSRP